MIVVGWISSISICLHELFIDNRITNLVLTTRFLPQTSTTTVTFVVIIIVLSWKDSGSRLRRN